MSFRVRLLAGFILIAPAAAAQAQAVDDAGNRKTPLRAIGRVTPEQAETRSAIHCNAERNLCLRAWRTADGQAWHLDMYDHVPAGANVATTRRIALPPGEDAERETWQVWPHLIREASGALLVGAERHRTAGFSGGGAGATQLVLLRLPPNAASVEVLTVQTDYSAMIRACFTEAEYRSRGACHDEYVMTGTFALAPAAGRPRFTFTTAARSFPRGVRGETEIRRFRRADLVWERDPGCSYRRSFAFNAASGRYEPDRPLPECSSYALP